MDVICYEWSPSDKLTKILKSIGFAYIYILIYWSVLVVKYMEFNMLDRCLITSYIDN